MSGGNIVDIGIYDIRKDIERNVFIVTEQLSNVQREFSSSGEIIAYMRHNLSDIIEDMEKNGI